MFALHVDNEKKKKREKDWETGGLCLFLFLLLFSFFFKKNGSIAMVNKKESMWKSRRPCCRFDD
jgi:hypothetical protein